MLSKRLQTVTIILGITSICMMCMAFIVYHITANSIKQEITDAYNVSLLHTKYRMETFLQSLDRAAIQFERVPEVERFIAQEDLNSFDLPAMVKLMQRVHSSMDYVDNFVVYNHDTGELHATNNYMPPLYSYYLPAVEEFSSLSEPKAFMNIKINDIPTTLYIRKLPVFSRDQPVYIIFHINQSIFDDFLGDRRNGGNGSYFIIDDQGELLVDRGHFTTEALNSFVYQINEKKNSIKDNVIGTLNSNQSFVTYLAPAYNDWVYSYAVSNTAFLHQLNTLRNVILLISAILFLAAIGLSLISSYWLWKGWHKIRFLLDDQQTDSNKKRTHNEFDDLFTKVQTVVNQSKDLKKEINEIMPKLKESYILTLLDNGVRTTEDWDKIEKHDIELKDGKYCCFCASIDLTQEAEEIYSPWDIITLEYAVVSVMKEVIEQKSFGFVINTPNNHSAAVLSAREVESSELLQTVKDVTTTIHEFIQLYFPITISIGVSRVRSNISHLNISYSEAQEMMNNKVISGGNQIFLADDTPEELLSEPFPIREMENDILYGIRTRNQELSYQAVEQLYTLRGTQKVNFKWLQSKLVETAQSLNRQIEKRIDLNSNIREPTLNELLQLFTLEDWVGWFKKDCIDPHIKFLESQHQSNTESVITKIKDFVSHHTETDLQLETCCKSLNIPVSFAKQALKERMDITFTELVLQTRIEQAKEWLKQGNMSVDDIARKLQYSNAQNFSRTFKKVVGVPPGQYRAGLRE